MIPLYFRVPKISIDLESITSPAAQLLGRYVKNVQKQLMSLDVRIYLCGMKLYARNFLKVLYIRKCPKGFYNNTIDFMSGHGSSMIT